MIAKARWAGLLAATLLLLVGCGGGGGGGGGEADPEPSGDAGGSAEQEGEGLVIEGEEIAPADLYRAAQEEGQILLYTTYAPEAMQAVSDVFTEDTGIAVTQERLVSPQMFERVMSELGADQLEADIIESNDIALMEQQAEAGVFQAHRVPNHDELPEELVRDDELFYIANRPLFGIAYNTELVSEDEAPQDWPDLLEPQWQGRLGVVPIATGIGWTTQLMLHENYGEEYWEGLAAQQPRIYDSIVPAAEEMIRGEVPVTINHVGTVLLKKSQGAPVEMVFPEGGIAAPPHFAGVGATAAHPSAAQVYLNWRLSLRGGQVFADLNGDYGADPGITAPTIADTVIPQPDEIEIFTPTLEDWTTRKEELAPVWSEIFNIAE